MSIPTTSRTSSHDSADSLRKRVCKACDRCRLKKSKCDGSSPCSRCIADNSICVFGERRKTHDKIYPKGYVEMLEQQQGQLVAGLQEMYHMLRDAQCWIGPALREYDEHPLTHDILKGLNIVKDGSLEHFEEDTDRLQQRLLSQGALYTTRRGSVSSDSEHSHFHGHARTKSHPELVHSPPLRYKESLGFNGSATPSPVSRSPVALAAQIHPLIKPSPLHNESPAQGPMTPMENNTFVQWDDPSIDLSQSGDFGSSIDQHYTDTQFNLQPPPYKTMFPGNQFIGWGGMNQSMSYMGTSERVFSGTNADHSGSHPWGTGPMDFDDEYSAMVNITR